MKSEKMPLDYLAASGVVRMRENQLVNAERRARIEAAKTPGEVYRILQECGYDISEVRMNQTGAEGMRIFSALISRAREELYRFADSVAETHAIADFFRVKIDCHNIKVILKSKALQKEDNTLLLNGGTLAKDAIVRMLSAASNEKLPGCFADAATEARQILETSMDGQRADFVLDRAMLDEQARLATESGVECLCSYAKRLADSANLRTCVRLLRAAVEPVSLTPALSEQGSVEASRLIHALEIGAFTDPYKGTALEQAAQIGADVLQGIAPTAALETACEAAETQLFADSRYLTAGPELLIQYIVRREQEFKTLRIFMAKKMRAFA